MPEPCLLLFPVAAEVPDIGVVGIFPSSKTEPVIGGIENGIRDEAVEQHDQILGDMEGRVNGG